MSRFMRLARLLFIVARSDRARAVIIRWLCRLAYLRGRPPWDTGIPPPELVEVVEGPKALPPGRALDLGCGTGTNVTYLALHGWEAVGVDIAGLAIKRARRKAEAAGVAPRLIQDDVTRLPELGLGDGFSLLFDRWR